MKQLTQNLKDGEMELLDIPTPMVQKNTLLVKNFYSAISAGTEGRSVRDARLGYIGKAKARPKEFKQVLNTVMKMGIRQTYSLVMNKLNAPSPLGYSSVGEVLEVGEGVENFKVGDIVACGGQGAVHAEVVSVLENLCVKIPDSVDLRYAAFTTIASIVIQGVRQSEVRLGEYCVIIGLGLLGQIAVQILNAAGVRTIGVDIDPSKVELAKKNGIDLAIHRDHEGIEEQIVNYCGGFGADAVIITAATSSNDPVNLAGAVSRKKGKVISVGRVSTDFNRDIYYNKELDLRMSCSYGPGRYDTEYEEKGHDYPVGYVRWTENRNMQAYVDLLAQNKIDLSTIITHDFGFKNAKKAYDIITNDSEPYLGMILKYDHENVKTKKVINFGEASVKKNENLSVGFIGAGSFAQKFLIPNVQRKSNLVSVATKSGNNATNVARKYDFKNATCDGSEVINNEDINTIFIATRHDSHAKYVKEAIKANKNVFVEKPLCLTEEELEEISEEYSRRQTHLMVGFNRRFAPQIKEITKVLGFDSVKTINYRVNLGPIDSDHWTQDKEIGGGRVIGEVCHFIDLCMFLANSKPDTLSAFAVEDPLKLNNTLSLIIRFKNGSIANINYYANGNEALDKEYLEVHSNGISCVLNDYQKLVIYGKKKRKMKSNMDKGHAEEISRFLECIKKGEETPISFEDIYWTTKMTFDVLTSIKTKQTIIY
ncbi:MAG: bi-domain-containing oxidoreductase [Bacteroidia bacterium]|nr:bi-domain-containing oxidoreductase [Bacteroidia bacterium]